MRSVLNAVPSVAGRNLLRTLFAADRAVAPALVMEPFAATDSATADLEPSGASTSFVAPAVAVARRRPPPRPHFSADRKPLREGVSVSTANA